MNATGGGWRDGSDDDLRGEAFDRDLRDHELPDDDFPGRPPQRRRRTRVGVNLLWLVPNEVGGTEEYTVRLLGALADLDPDDLDISLYVNKSFRVSHDGLAGRFRTVVAPLSGSSRPMRVAAEASWLAFRSRRDRLDVVHHAGGTMPAVRTAPGVVTLHDLQPMSYPERFGVVKRSYIALVAPRSLRAATAVICLTDFTASDAVRLAAVDPSRIRLVPPGVDDPGPDPDPVLAEAVLQRYGLVSRPFALYPAITYAHKNHETLIAAFARLVAERPEVRLVLTGAEGPYEPMVRAAVVAHGLEGQVVRTGRIPEADLDVLYRRAALLAFPSLYEGFGLPVLEAMSRGCPAAISRTGALPEVAGDAALMVSPEDPVAWAEAMAELFDQPRRRTVLARRGVERARRFRWPDSAESLAAVYRAPSSLGLPHPAGPTSKEDG